MANLRLSPTLLAAAFVALGCSLALPAMAQVGIQFGGGGGHRNNSLFNNRQRAPIIIEPSFRQQQQYEISDMKRCEQAYGQQAVEACMTAVLRDRDNAKAHRLLADALLATGRPADALNEYNEALRLDSDNDEAKRGREMAQRYLAGTQPPPPATTAGALNPYAANQAQAQPQPVAAPTATVAGPRDGEWSGRMLRQCTGFSDEGPASVTVTGTQFNGVFFSGGGGRDLRGSIAGDGKVEASGKDTAGTLIEVKGRLLSPQTLMAEGYALNCKMTLLLGRGGAPVSAPSAMAAAQAPTPRTTSGNPFDGEWSGTLTPRGGHFVVAATVVDGKLVIKQERQGSRITAQGSVDPSGQTTLSGSAGDAATRGDNMEIKGTFAGNMFVGQGRVGDRWAEMKLTRTGAPPPPAATVVAQAPPAQAPAVQAPAPQPAAPAPKPVEAATPKAVEAPKPEPAPRPEPPVAAAPPAPAKPAPAPKTQTAAAAPAPTTVAPSPAPMVDKQAPTITVPAKLETDGPVVELTGKIADTSSIIEFSINGQPVPVGAGGSFTVRRGVPVGTSELKLAAVDEWGNMAQKTIAVNRKASAAVAAAPAAPPASPVNDEAPKAAAPAKVASVADQLKAIEFGNYRALVIGNNKYTKVRPLETAQNDAKVVADLLTKEYGFQVTTLTDATRQQIMEALYRMRAQLGENDNLLVYYAGHGVRDDQTGRGYWLPVDADPDLPTNWIPTTDLTDVIKAMRARHIMVVADSCYSGTLVRSVSAGMRSARDNDISAWVKRIVTKRSRTVMSSGGLEPVMDGGGGNHSVFAKAFIDALRENPDVLDGQGLFASIRRPIVLNSDQTPEYADIRQAGHDGGDFLFVKKLR
ncbi:MAG: caspase family protein [Rhodospirillales bacterium]|nr:caspase family protein [Rhodospirillales bacterium]